MEKLSRNNTVEEVDATEYRCLVGSLCYLTHVAELDVRRWLRQSVHAATGNGESRHTSWVTETANTLATSTRPRACAGRYSSLASVSSVGSRSSNMWWLCPAVKEYIAATTASAEAIWLARLLGDLNGRDAEAVELQVDSKSTLALAKNPVFHERSKHIRVRITSFEGP